MMKSKFVSSSSDLLVKMIVIKGASFPFTISWLLRMYYYFLFGMLSLSVVASYMQLEKIWVKYL